MIFSESEKNKLLDEFPNIKLSYENLLHKKVYHNTNDLYLAIPQGKKCFLWFREINEQPCCLILEFGKNNNFYDMKIKIVSCCFNYQLSYGTIVYGTYFYYNNTSLFTLEDIFYYKGDLVSNKIWKDKFDLFSILLENDIKQVKYNDKFIIIGLPVMTTCKNDMIKQLEVISYKIKHIQMRNTSKKNVSDFIPYHIFLDNKENNLLRNNVVVSTHIQENLANTPEHKIIKNREIVFKIKPDIQNDIYHLYCLDNSNNLMYYDVASIPNFTTSVMMNKLFRNIKENSNLDYLEESDNEDEFENDKQDRFVYLDKEYNMICRYNFRFKKWHPISIADNNKNISSYNEVLNLTKITKR